MRMYIIYDTINRPVLMQDANMAATYSWNYIRYDSRNRPISQGIFRDTTTARRSRSGMQSYVNTITYTNNWYENRNTTSATGFYTARVFPTTASGALTPLAFAYYDDYDLKQNGVPYTYVTQFSPAEPGATKAAVKGMPTMTRKITIGPGITGTVWLLNAVFYDKRGNTIQTRSNNHLNYNLDSLTDAASMLPDFVGKPLQSKVVKITKNAAGTAKTNTVLTTFNYDTTNKFITSIDQKYNSQATVHLVAYNYNLVGQLIKKNLGFTGSAYIQNLDYRYNIRGQLTSINNSKLSNDTGKTSSDTTDVFGMNILYDKVDAGIGNTADYTGKISAVKWMSRDIHGNRTNERSYKYSYDLLERYTGEVYAERSISGTGSFSINQHGFDETITGYDVGGNILGLKRNSAALATGATSNYQVDSLVYGYFPANPNRLKSVTDGTGSNYTSWGFRNVTGDTTSYTYDNNGNLTTDYYKGLNLRYNFLNKIDSIQTKQAALNGAYITYTYDGNGGLLRRLTYPTGISTTPTSQDYIDGFMYIADTLSYFPSPEGRVVKVGNTFVPEYIISDQQGNARFSFQNNAGTVKIIQENSFYAFGESLANSTVSPPATPANHNLYNGGAERQDIFAGLPDYDMTWFRNYDPAIGRWTGVDPMGESAESLSGYQYSGNNPVMFNDPLGNTWGGGVTVGSGRAVGANGQGISMLPMPQQNTQAPFTAGPLRSGNGHAWDRAWAQDSGGDINGFIYGEDYGNTSPIDGGDYTESWNRILSGSGYSVNSSGYAVLNTSAGDVGTSLPQFDSAKGTIIMAFGKNGNYEGSMLDPSKGPHGLIAKQDGQYIGIYQILENLGLTDHINLDAVQDGMTLNQYMFNFGLTTATTEGFSGISRIGTNMQIYSATERGGVFMGNAFVKTISLAKTAKMAGIAGALISTGFDAYGVYRGTVSPGEFGENAFFSAVGIWGGPIGTGVSAVYFGLNAYYPGGANQAYKDFVGEELKYGGPNAPDGVTNLMN